MSFHCNECGGIAALLKSEDEEEADAAAARKKAEEEMKEIVKNVAFKVSGGRGKARQAPFDFGLWREESESVCTFSDGAIPLTNLSF